MVFYILRGAFILLVAAVTMLHVLGSQEGLRVDLVNVLLMVVLTLGIAVVVIAVDIKTPNKKLSAVSGVFLGLGAGLLVAYALGFVIDLFGQITAPPLNFDVPDSRTAVDSLSAREHDQWQRYQAYMNLVQGVKVFIGLITCYIGISLVLQTKDDFRFVIPYVEFAKRIRGTRPTLLDTSVIIDGRILDVLSTEVLQGTLLVPKFVLNEMQTIADSADKLKRARGRRGLEILQKLQANDHLEVSIHDADAEGANVDQKLVSLAQDLQARVMTNDTNLAKIAQLRGVTVINLNDLAKSLKPVVLPGEPMNVKIIKPGESSGQGVGYLDDGTMVVVENARDRMNQDVEMTVTSTLQTSAGRMIFGRVNDNNGSRASGDGSEKPGAESADDEDAATASDTDTRDEPRRSSGKHSGRNPRRG